MASDESAHVPGDPLTALAVIADGEDHWDDERQQRVKAGLFGEGRSDSGSRTLRVRPLFAAGLALLLFGGGVAAASVLGEARPAPEEITSFAKTNGTSQDEAFQAIVDQRQLERLTAEARLRLASSFAGVWVARGRITLGLTDASPASADRDVSALVSDLGLEGRVAIVRRARSEKTLLILQREIQNDLDAVNSGANRPIEVEADLPDSVVLVRRPSGPATDVQQRYLSSAAARNGVRVVRAIGTPRLDIRRPDRR